jgi:hypothetical protein
MVSPWFKEKCWMHLLSFKQCTSGNASSWYSCWANCIKSCGDYFVLKLLDCTVYSFQSRYSTLKSFIHSFQWHVQNLVIPCRSQELLLFLPVMYFFLPPFPTNYSSILFHPILPSISWSTFQSSCFQIHMQYSFGNSIFFHSLCMSKPT